MDDELNKRLEHLRQVTETQCKQPDVQRQDYHRGMANGLLLAVAIMEDRSVVRYIEKPS